MGCGVAVHLCLQSRASTRGIALWVLWHQLALSLSWTHQQLVRLCTLRIIVTHRIPACPGSFLLAAVGVQHSSTPSVGTGSFLMQTRGTKHGVNGNTDRAAGSSQAGRQLHDNSQRCTRCFSLTRKPHACPPAGTVFCLLQCWSPARVLENAGGLRVTFLSQNWWCHKFV